MKNATVRDGAAAPVFRYSPSVCADTGGDNGYGSSVIELLSLELLSLHSATGSVGTTLCAYLGFGYRRKIMGTDQSGGIDRLKEHAAPPPPDFNGIISVPEVSIFD